MADELIPNGTVTDELYEALAPLAYADATFDNHLYKFCATIAGMLQEIEDYSRDRGDDPGWSVMLDIQTTPEKAINWLGQFVGVRPPDWMEIQEKRDMVAAKEGFNRGSPAAIRAAVQPFLRGSKTVNFYEQDTGPYHFTVQTYTSETVTRGHGEINILTAINSQKPAGLTFTHVTTPGQLFSQLRANYATFNAVKTAYSNWDEVRADTP